MRLITDEISNALIVEFGDERFMFMPDSEQEMTSEQLEDVFSQILFEHHANLVGL